MFKLDKSYLSVLTIFTGLSFFPLAMPFSFSVDQTVDPRFKSIPYQIGNWVGKDMELDEKTYEILETRNILSRLYLGPDNESVHLLLVSSNKDRRVAHPPEVCYTSSNFDIISSKTAEFEVLDQKIPVKQFVAEDQNDPRHKEYVLYFYQVGERFTANYYAQQLQFAFGALTRQESQILLVRLSGSSEKSFSEFLTQILLFLKPRTPQK